MKTFSSIFKFEAKRLILKRNFIILLLIWIILFAFILDGYMAYRDSQKNKKEYQNFEDEKVKNYVTITQYGGYGIGLSVIPNITVILFSNSGKFVDMNSNINSGETLDIYMPFKDSIIFKSRSKNYLEFAGILFLLSSFLSIIYGFDITKRKEYLKCLSSLLGLRRTLCFTIASRILISIIISGCLLFSIPIVLLAFGLNLYNWVLYILFFLISLNIIFFFLLGAYIGSKKKNKVALLGIIYFLAVFILPWGLNKLSQINADVMKSNNSIRLENLKIMMEWERNARDQVGTFKSGNRVPKEIRELIANVLKKEYRKFNNLENRRKYEITTKIRFNHLLLSLFPPSFFLSSFDELSSRGLMSYIDFYSFNQKTKYEFIAFYVNEKFVKETKPGEIKPFKTGDKYILNLKSNIPFHFILGIILTVFYATVVTYRTYININASIFPKVDKKDFNNLKKNFLIGEHNHITYYNKIVLDFFLNIFFGKLENRLITIDGKIIRNRKPFLYIPEYTFFPKDIRLFDLITFFQKIIGSSQNIDSNMIEKLKNAYISDKTNLAFILILIEIAREKIDLIITNNITSPNDLKNNDELIKLGNLINTVKNDKVFINFTSTDFVFPPPDFQAIILNESGTYKIITTPPIN
jgi:hypothetical protein